jgi:hypothetical protein
VDPHADVLRERDPRARRQPGPVRRRFRDDWDDIRLDVSEYRHVGERAIALGRLVGTARRSGLRLSTERAWAATFRQRRVARMAIHEDWSTAVDWLNSPETTAQMRD